jgi:hypothetical protein
MIHLGCWAQRWSATLRIFASVVQLYTHFIDEATNSPALTDGLAHGITGQTTNNDDYQSQNQLQKLYVERASRQRVPRRALRKQLIQSQQSLIPDRDRSAGLSFFFLFRPNGLLHFGF